MDDTKKILDDESERQQKQKETNLIEKEELQKTLDNLKKKKLNLCEQALPEIKQKANQLIEILKEYGFEIEEPYIEKTIGVWYSSGVLYLIKFKVYLVYHDRNLLDLNFVASPNFSNNKLEYNIYVIEGNGDTPTIRYFLTEMEYIGRKTYSSLDNLINEFIERNKETLVSFKDLINE